MFQVILFFSSIFFSFLWIPLDSSTLQKRPTLICWPWVLDMSNNKVHSQMGCLNGLLQKPFRSYRRLRSHRGNLVAWFSLFQPSAIARETQGPLDFCNTSLVISADDWRNHHRAVLNLLEVTIIPFTEKCIILI